MKLASAAVGAPESFVYARRRCTMVDFKSLVPWKNNKSQAPALREDYFDPFVTFRREMDRMFDHFFDGFPGRAGNGPGTMAPAIDLDETDKEMVVTAELPGVTDKDIEVSLAGDVLTIKGEKKTETEEKKGDSYYTERRYGSFARSLRLPFEVKDEQVHAKFKDGVLTVRLPKPAEIQSQVRRIDVKAQ
jgi:HSP20 family protein